jgi:hypothetical protein
MAFAMVASSAGHGLNSSCANRREAMIAAMIPKTRFLGSSMRETSTFALSSPVYSDRHLSSAGGASIAAKIPFCSAIRSSSSFLLLT